MRRYMELGLGYLRLAPDAFWSMTVQELMAAMDGFGESKGARKKADPAELAEDMRALMETDAWKPGKSIAGKTGAVRL